MAMDGEPAVSGRLGALVREAKKVESLRPFLAASLTSFDRKAAELDQTRLSVVKLQAELGKSRVEFLHTRHRLAVVLEADHEESSAGELHPRALAEPDVNVSAHPTPIT